MRKNRTGMEKEEGKCREGRNRKEGHTVNFVEFLDS